MEKLKSTTSPQVLGRIASSLRKCKDQNDRIGKIYRFRKWFDRIELTNQLKLRYLVNTSVLSLRLIEQSDKRIEYSALSGLQQAGLKSQDQYDLYQSSNFHPCKQT